MVSNASSLGLFEWLWRGARQRGIDDFDLDLNFGLGRGIACLAAAIGGPVEPFPRASE